jgi:hypothetical protein
MVKNRGKIRTVNPLFSNQVSSYPMSKYVTELRTQDSSLRGIDRPL